MAEESKYLRSNDLAQMTGIPASTWRYWASCGKGPKSIKVGRHRLYERLVVEEFLASHQDVSGGAR